MTGRLVANGTEEVVYPCLRICETGFLNDGGYGHFIWGVNDKGWITEHEESQ